MRISESEPLRQVGEKVVGPNRLEARIDRHIREGRIAVDCRSLERSA